MGARDGALNRPKRNGGADIPGKGVRPFVQSAPLLPKPNWKLETLKSADGTIGFYRRGSVFVLSSGAIGAICANPFGGMA
jgi:hypothetical protein